MKIKTRYLVGVDEAGRGPLAGPVAIGVAVVPHDFDWTLLPGVADSKQVRAAQREAIARNAKTLRRQEVIDFRVALISHTVIDRIGISRAVHAGVHRCFRALALDPRHTTVKLDGLLHAPAEYRDQETITKGDAKEKVIGLASILAKVARDAHMVRLARANPLYGFEIHKGYGTAAHRECLKLHGLSPVHRRTFCRRFTSP